MNQLNSHNLSLRDYLELDECLRDTKALRELVDLDLIDSVLRTSLTIEDMREAGSFFTGSMLAKFTLDRFSIPINSDAVVLDPTCGAGNLLIVCSRELEVKATLSATLEIWGNVLCGYDVHASFIEATKLRLIVEALSRGARKDCSIERSFDLLRNIVCRDAMLVDANELKQVTHVIMNPPFSEWASPRDYYWKNGKVNAAGVIFDKYLRMLPAECLVSAILPDVLRSGSRYGGFREFVDSRLVATCTIWGRFNAKTDVDVFVLSGKKVEDSTDIVSWFIQRPSYRKLSEEFEVRVGPLVAYRDAEIGGEFAYCHPKNCPSWQRVDKATETRRFSGKVLKPPFVVIKRTSSPSDKYRANATLINIRGEVAVENHMIVIKPKNSTLKDCVRLLKILKSKQTNDYLNERIRLRHLTVSAIKDIPLVDE